MVEHHIQQSILLRLKSVDSLSFTELKPGELDNKLFTYHLKIVVRDGFVYKNSDGEYSLTSAGRKLWQRMRENPLTVSERAFSVLFLIIRDHAHGWLLYRRNNHPLLGRVGFMHALPNHLLASTDAAHAQALAKTGLDCNFTCRGSGFFRTYSGESLESFTNFTVLSCEQPKGELIADDESADYFWVKEPDFSAPDMLPNMKRLSDAYLSDSALFYIDESLII